MLKNISRKKHMVYTSLFILGSFLSNTSFGFFDISPFVKIFKESKNEISRKKVKLPIVGGREYDISLLGVEKLHPFDSAKYGNVQDFLMNHLGLAKHNFTAPRMITQDELRLVHTQKYLDTLQNSWTIRDITEIPGLGLIPNWLLQKLLLNPMKLATGGTVQAAELALKHGWAINLGGGYHHAKRDTGGGFCVYADIPIAAEKLWMVNPNLKIMVIDLDAHQGNGHESVFAGDKRVTIFDMYNADIYPHDTFAKKYITYNVPVYSNIHGTTYLEILDKTLDLALSTLEKNNQKPDLIIYNAGTDILAGDRLGCMDVSEQNIIDRDSLVFDQAQKRHIPIVYLFSGGYTKQSAQVIGKSLKHILQTHVGIAQATPLDTVPRLFA